MSTFGSLFRVTTYGESHCASVGCIVDGCPPVRPKSHALPFPKSCSADAQSCDPRTSTLMSTHRKMPHPYARTKCVPPLPRACRAFPNPYAHPHRCIGSSTVCLRYPSPAQPAQARPEQPHHSCAYKPLPLSRISALIDVHDILMLICLFSAPVRPYPPCAVL